MSSRYLWGLGFAFLAAGFGCGGAGLYLVITQVDAGLYLILVSGLPILMGAVFAAMAFRYGLKGQ